MQRFLELRQLSKIDEAARVLSTADLAGRANKKIEGAGG